MSGIDALRDLPNTEFHEDVHLAKYTTWKVGGPARVLVFANDARGVSDVVRIVREEDLPLFVLGNGSNLLVSDDGLDGVCMRLRGELSSVAVEGHGVKAGGGALLSSVVTVASNTGLSGLEFTFGIPGTVGGAVITNAGAFSESTAGVIGRVHTLTREGERRFHEQFNRDYRGSLVPPDEIIIGAYYPLREAEPEEIRKRMDDVRAKRRATQPWGMATAGSVFKNPPGESAGRLIEECGLKGKTLGKARISEIHANFVINTGGATAADIKALIDLATSEVASRFGVNLETEVELVGFS